VEAWGAAAAVTVAAAVDLLVVWEAAAVVTVAAAVDLLVVWEEAAVDLLVVWEAAALRVRVASGAGPVLRAAVGAVAVQDRW